jgi:DNA-binding FrmR family transcriptional regulator
LKLAETPAVPEVPVASKVKKTRTRAPKKARGGIIKFQAGGYARQLTAQEKALMGMMTTITGSKQVNQKPGFLNQALGAISGAAKGFDLTDLSNLGMAASTIATNKIVGNRQRAAANESRYTIPTLSKSYTRKSTPFTTMAQGQATQLQRKYQNMAGAQGDLDRSIAIQSEGANKSAEMIAKGQYSDRERLDQLTNQQVAADARVDAQNAQITGQNRAIDANVNKQIQLVSSNEALAQNTAVTNLLTGLERNILPKKMRNTMEESSSLYNDENYQKLIKEASDAASPETQQAYYKQYTDAVGAAKLAGGNYATP